MLAIGTSHATARRRAANAGSATLSADVGSCLKHAFHGASCLVLPSDIKKRFAPAHSVTDWAERIAAEFENFRQKVCALVHYTLLELIVPTTAVSFAIAASK